MHVYIEEDDWLYIQHDNNMTLYQHIIVMLHATAPAVCIHHTVLFDA